MEVTFETTSKGKQIINLGDGYLVFSDMTKCPKGYKWLVYSRDYTEMIPIKNADGTRDVHEVRQRDSYVFNFKMKQDSEGLRGVPRGTIPPKLVNWFVKTFDKLTDADGVFPYSNISVLKQKIESKDFSKFTNKKKKRKVPTKKQIRNEANAMAILRRSMDEENN